MLDFFQESHVGIMMKQKGRFVWVLIPPTFVHFRTQSKAPAKTNRVGVCLVMNGMGVFGVGVGMGSAGRVVSPGALVLFFIFSGGVFADGLDGWMGREVFFLYTYTYDEAQDRTGQDRTDLFSVPFCLSTD